MISVRIDIEPTLADERPLPWALGQFNRAISDANGSVTKHGPADTIVHVEKDGVGDREGFIFEPASDGLTIRAATPSGLAYGITELADRIRFGGLLPEALSISTEEHSPATPVRSVLRAFSSDALDLDWYRDRGFWTAYLDHLAENRINRLQLAFGMQYNYSHDPGVYDNYFTFAYPFLLDLQNWNVRAKGVDDHERRKNLEALKFASEQAAERGIEFFLGLWNHALSPELEPHENLRYPVTGLAADDIADYSAQALEALLRECPDIAGVTFRVHYEGGVHETIRTSFWTKVFEGIAACGHPVKLDMHAKGVDEEILAAAHSALNDVTLSAKYWAEHAGLPYHQARVRDMERARPADTTSLAGVTQNTRRFTRYGYGDFLRNDSDTDLIFRIWPGTQRFLLWADSVLFAGYGRHATIGGAKGAELCEPLTFRGRKNTGHGPRDLYIDPVLHQSASDDWRKYAHTYRLWGRLLYNPDAKPEEWRRSLRASYGASARAIEQSLSQAGRILPLTTVALGISASNNFWWPEVPTNLPLVPKPGSIYEFDTPEPFNWGAVSPFDPELFDTTDEYVTSIAEGRPTGKITPIHVACRLEQLAAETLTAWEAAGESENPDHRRARIDIFIVAQLGRMYASRLRAGVQLGLFGSDDDQARIAAMLRHLTAARDALAQVVEAAEGVYFRDLAFGDRPTERGHWRERLVQLDDELAELRTRFPDAGERVANDPVPPREATHPVVLSSEPAPGGGVGLRVDHVPDGGSVTFHARPLNQGAEWLVRPATSSNGVSTCVIEGDEVDPAFAVQWYVSVHSPGSPPVNMPSIGEDLCATPYLIVPAPLQKSG